MTVFHALVLGIVQALTEFLPISSSGHLNVFPWLFGWNVPESFDVALHIGTLLAIVFVFFKDWIKLIIAGLNKLFKKEDSVDGRIFWSLFFSTIAASIFSLVLDKVSELIIGDNLNLEMLLIAIALIVLGIILYIVDKKAKSNVKYEKITFKQSMIIGLSQAIAAAFPGVSRSGITMTTARALNVDRESAAKYSFLLATPITVGAIIFDLAKFEFNLAFFVGIIASFLLGLVVIKWLLNYLKKGSFKGFAIYRIVFGLLIIGAIIIRMI